MEQSPYITPSGMYQVFDKQAEPLKLKVAESLQYKGYIQIKTFDPTYSLTRKGVEYCNKLKKML